MSSAFSFLVFFFPFKPPSKIKESHLSMKLSRDHVLIAKKKLLVLLAAGKAGIPFIHFVPLPPFRPDQGNAMGH